MANTTKHIIAAIMLKNAVNIKPDVVAIVVKSSKNTNMLKSFHQTIKYLLKKLLQNNKKGS